MSEPPRTLYRLQACPFCERVVNTLDELGLAYRSRFVEPMHSDRDVVKRLSGKRTVPALVDEPTGVTLTESANIVAYLERTYGEGGPLAHLAGAEAGSADPVTEGSDPTTEAGDPAGEGGDAAPAGSAGGGDA